ncbi:HDOD domain-containing protein [Rhodoferax sp. 4810]|uniref:HDOD domain-containing protein n=1 Tax=Thiospirillum jenense TaxID=1653858 RepID=A0A839H420_9GAMM|nr:HDOD domain-containing protein [Thiospirillum jenense]MBB1072995.1 HDOD domain-containing protein [Rhodoferax jenense]MBB1124943.1 HDOD domain-containing protein [Thiospirillum jenense]
MPVRISNTNDNTRVIVAEEFNGCPGLTKPDVAVLFNNGTLLQCTAGEQLFSANTQVDKLYILLAGHVVLNQPGTHLSTVLEPGDWFGDVDFNANVTHFSEAITQTPVRTLAIDANAFAALPIGIKTYLTDQMRQLNRRRLNALQIEVDHLSKDRRSLIEMLFALRTQNGNGFGKTITAQQLFAKVPSLPVSTVNLLNKMLDERTTKTEIVELVSTDAALTAILLKAANSPTYGFNNPVTNVNHAVVLLGHNAVYQIIMSESMRQSLPNKPLFTEIHQRAIELSRLTFTLSQMLNIGKPAEVATIGILGEIGSVIVELLKTYNSRLELLFSFADDAEMGAELLRSWSLPDSLCTSLEYQHYPEFAAPEQIPDTARINVAILYLARQFYHQLHQTNVTLPNFFMREYLQLLGLRNTSSHELLYERLLPRLRTQRHVLPKSLVEVLGVDLETS